MENIKEKEKDDIYQGKITKFQEAIYGCSELTGLVRSSRLDGNNDYDDCCWSAVFHKMWPDVGLNKKTRIHHGARVVDYSVIFVYNHESGKSLCVRGDFDPNNKHGRKNICLFAKFFADRNVLVAQFFGMFIMYQLDPERFGIQKVMHTIEDPIFFQHFYSRTINNVVFDENNLNYLATIDDNGNPSLIKFNWDTSEICLWNLKGYMTSFGSLHCLFVKELSEYPMVILGVLGSQKTDPDMGYSMFVKCTGRELSLHNYKNEFFQNELPNKFIFSEPTADNYIQIAVYNNDRLLTKTIVPTVFDD